MSQTEAHPLELAFIEAIAELEATIAEASAAGVAAASPGAGSRSSAPGRRRRGSSGQDDIWVIGIPWWIPPGTRTTQIAYPWEDPSGWTVAHSGD